MLFSVIFAVQVASKHTLKAWSLRSYAHQPRGRGSCECGLPGSLLLNMPPKLRKPPSRGSTQIKSKSATDTICTLCEEIIVEEAVAKKGQESIFCEGACGWLHRLCAGLSGVAFATATQSTCKFLCSQCRLSESENEVVKLQQRVSDLESKLSTLLTKLTPEDNVSSRVSPAATSWAGVVSSGDSVECGTSKSTCKEAVHPSSQRRSNLIVFGLKESEKGAPRHVRCREDILSASELLSWIDPLVTSALIVD